MKRIPVTRRQFTTGAAAASAAVAVGLPLKAAAVAPSEPLDKAVLAGLEGDSAVFAQRLVRLDRLFAYVDTHYFTDERCDWRWGPYYSQMIELAQWFYCVGDEDLTPAEREFKVWLRKRIPSSDDIRQETWAPVEGLSATFRWHEAVLHAALMHCAVATMALHYVTYDGCQNPSCAHADIAEAHQRAWWRLRNLCSPYSGPWGWPRAEKPADLIVLRRVWHIWKDGDDVIRHKFLPQALACLQARGIRWETSDNGQGDRTWTWVRPDA